MRRFLITGLPRSRTAWFAAAACLVQDAVCLHEPLAYLDTSRGLSSLWDVPGYRYVGAADSALGLHLSRLLDEMPDLRVLIIDRAIEDVERSLVAMGFPHTKLCAILRRRLDVLPGHPMIKRVRFDRIHEDFIDCIAHLMPGCTMDGLKLAQFEALNIQADPYRARQQAVARTGDIEYLLGADVLAELRAG